MSIFGIVVYILWGLFLFLFPVLVFVRFLALPAKLVFLKGLAVKPYFDKEKNVTRVDTNYDEFMTAVCAGNAPVWKRNIPLLILGALCRDAHDGVKYHPEVYLARYKNSIRRFTGYIFLGSFLPALLLLFRFLIFYVPENALLVIVLQACCLLLVFSLGHVLCYLFEAFEAVFYKNWFDKILNFDALTIRELRPQALDSLAAVFQQDIWQKINEGTAALAGQIEKFRNFREQGREFSGEDIVETAESKIIMLGELGAALGEICDKTDTALKGLASLARRNKTDINAITENTAALIELKGLMLNWRNNSQDAELDTLRQVTEKLEHGITQSFSNMEQTAELNARELSASFERFSEACNRLSTLPAPGDERTLIATLQNLNENLNAAVKQIGNEANSEV
jgi:hypothetical protein